MTNEPLNINEADIGKTCKPEKRVVWINVYPYGNDIVSRHFNTKREADRDDAQNPTTIKRVACVRVEYEEGEGL